MKKVFLAISAAFVLTFILLAPKTYSCGCGLAISDEKIFNALKETQAYLLINIKNENSYNEMPFFRMVSMDEAYNVTIVFPIQGVPYDVDGRTIPARQFLEEYNINNAETNFVRQSFSGFIRKAGKNFEESSSGIFGVSNGFIGIVGLTFSRGLFREAGMKGIGEVSPLAHFEFEGGSLDVYDVNSASTLEEFVKTINIPLTGKVQELVTKYKDYFVAVLYLQVPSALDEDSRKQLALCPEQTERVKHALQEKTEFYYDEINKIIEGPCRQPLHQLIKSVTNINSGLKGNLVNMKFKDSNKFFYPTSIVNSYKYPITEQKYLIKAPSRLHINLESSEIDRTSNFASERWYKISSTEEDIEGEIVKAGFGVRFGDVARSANQAFYNNTGWLVFIIYLLIIILPLMHYHFKADESLTLGKILLTIGMFILGGLVLSSAVMAIKKKRKFALTLLLIWSLLLILNIIF